MVAAYLGHKGDEPEGTEVKKAGLAQFLADFSAAGGVIMRG
ncbi:hypothetical protein [Phaeospirillum tilakii]|uniref:Uncharacterized protein n=1 Tax=Phaeospirillum tilakii TaxID=741673 RepID=A0ABW5CCC0_9PROT